MVKLTVSNIAGNAVYTWQDSSTQTYLNIMRPGNYYVKVTNAVGCSLMDTIAVGELYPLKVSLGEDKFYCDPLPLTLTASVTGNANSFIWSDGSAADKLVITKAGTYTVSATDPASCVAADTITVFDNPLNAFKFPQDTAICNGANFKIDIKTPVNTLVKWGDGITGDSRSVTNGQYPLTLQNKDCIVAHRLSIAAIPLPVFKLRQDTTICEGFAIDVLANSASARYVWNTGNTSDRITVKSTGLYWAEALLNGCRYRDTFNLKVEPCDCDIVMPNAFSPNNDGINDSYRPVFKCFPLEYDLQIFNHYGQPLFETKDRNAFWDGNSKKQALPIGTYYYVLTYYDMKERKIVKRSGAITLLK